MGLPHLYGIVDHRGAMVSELISIIRTIATHKANGHSPGISFVMLMQRLGYRVSCLGLLPQPVGRAGEGCRALRELR